MLSSRAENVEITDEDKIVPMLLTNGMEYRCSACGQRLTEDAKMCPVCKSVFVSSAVIVSRADMNQKDKAYAGLIEKELKSINGDMLEGKKVDKILTVADKPGFTEKLNHRLEKEAEEINKFADSIPECSSDEELEELFSHAPKAYSIFKGVMLITAILFAIVLIIVIKRLI